jgi:hypothetical protein
MSRTYSIEQTRIKQQLRHQLRDAYSRDPSTLNKIENALNKIDVDGSRYGNNRKYVRDEKIRHRKRIRRNNKQETNNEKIWSVSY